MYGEKAFPFKNDILVHTIVLTEMMEVKAEVNDNIRNNMDIVTYLYKKERLLLDKTRRGE